MEKPLHPVSSPAIGLPAQHKVFTIPKGVETQINKPKRCPCSLHSSMPAPVLLEDEWRKAQTWSDHFNHCATGVTDGLAEVWLSSKKNSLAITRSLWLLWKSLRQITGITVLCRELVLLNRGLIGSFWCSNTNGSCCEPPLASALFLGLLLISLFSVHQMKQGEEYHL